MLTPRALEDLWSRFKNRGDQRARGAIIDNYTYLVIITAGRVVANLPPNMDRDDLITAGSMGLVKAVDQFDSGRQVKFETYAIALIRGAILESLREDDWVPRSVRERSRNLSRTMVELERELGHAASEEQIAERMGISTEEYARIVSDVGRGAVTSLEDILVGSGGDGESLHVGDILPDTAAGPTDEVEMRERVRQLGLSIDRLPDRERLVIALYYYEGLTFKEIGKVLTVSESRVYQLHTQAVIRMRGYLGRDRDLFRES